MANVMYSRVSENRDPKYLLCTSILNINKQKVVKKVALNSLAESHLQKIYENYFLLNDIFKDKPISAISVTMDEGALLFEFCEGKSLDTILDTYLEQKDIPSFLDTVNAYFQTLKEVYQPSFMKEKCEHTIFPNAQSFVFDDCCKTINIDGIFSNIFLTDKKNYRMIDYEWVLKFSVSFKYLIFRCIFWYLNDDTSRKDKLKFDLYQYFRISQKEYQQYLVMENDFQNYVRGTKVPLWKIYDGINSTNYTYEQFSEHMQKTLERSYVKVYYDFGEGFTEGNAFDVCNHNLNDLVTAQIPVVEGVKRVRIDPCEYISIIDVKECLAYTKTLEILPLEIMDTNGKKLEDSIYVFINDDPQIIYDIPNQTGELNITFVISELNKKITETLYEHSLTYSKLLYLNKEQKDVKDIQKNYIDKLNLLVAEKDNYNVKLEEIIQKNSQNATEELTKLHNEYQIVTEELTKLHNEYQIVTEELTKLHNERQMLINALDEKENHVVNIASELNAIKSTIWYRTIMRLRKIFGR